jgi:hypothetical protein
MHQIPVLAVSSLYNDRSILSGWWSYYWTVFGSLILSVHVQLLLSSQYWTSVTTEPYIDNPRQAADVTANVSAFLIRHPYLTVLWKVVRAGIAQLVWRLAMGWMIGSSIPGGNFSLRHRVQTGSGAHPASYQMGTGGSFPGDWSWPLTSIYYRGQGMRGAIPPLPQYVLMAWCLVKHWDNFTLLYFTYSVLWATCLSVLCQHLWHS